MIDKDKIIKEAIGEDFESIRYHDDCYITVRECKQIMDKLESKLKKLRVTDVIDSDFFYNELKRCIDDSYERDLDEKDFTLSEYKLIEEIKHVIKNHFL